MADLLPLADLSAGFMYPREYLRTVELGLIDFEPWRLIVGTEMLEQFEGLDERYPNSGYVPFAVRQDNDDVACWVLPPEVVIVHDFASPGWERRGPKFSNFHDWLRDAFSEYISWGDDEAEHYRRQANIQVERSSGSGTSQL